LVCLLTLDSIEGFPQALSHSSAAALCQASVAKGSAAVTTADEYQRFAEECMTWARGAKSDAERKAFLDMARAWTQAAASSNGLPIDIVPPDDAGPEQPTEKATSVGSLDLAGISQKVRA
jgi:hypothetical protein